MNIKQTLQFVRKLIENAKKAFIVKKEPGEALMVMGDEVDLAEISYTWGRNADRFQLISTHLILEFVNKDNKSSEEIAVYKQAFKDFGQFMIKCQKEDTTARR